MNMRLFALLGVVACAAVTGCVVVGNTPDGSGGNGGNGAGVGGSGQGGSGQGGSAGMGQGGQGGTGGMAACTTCGDAVTNGGTTCMGTSTDLYNKLADCACGAMGNCTTACMDSTCAGMPPSADCAKCVQQTTEANGGCQESFNACAADF